LAVTEGEEAKPEGEEGDAGEGEAAEGEGEATAEGEEGEGEKSEGEEDIDIAQMSHQTRWVLPPKSRKKIYVKFFSTQVESVSCRLHFEVVNGYRFIHNDNQQLSAVRTHINSRLKLQISAIECR
jgi:hypothetical protein